MPAKTQLAALVAGIGVIVIGVLVLLDAQDVITFGFGALAPVACAVAGTTLLASGLTRRG
jgi:hypothetical protein